MFEQSKFTDNFKPTIGALLIHFFLQPPSGGGSRGPCLAYGIESLSEKVKHRPTLTGLQQVVGGSIGSVVL